MDKLDTKYLKLYRVHIEPEINLDKTVKVSPRVNIWKDVRIGKNVTIERNVDIGEGSVIGDNVTIGEFAKIGRGVIIGENLIIDSQSFIDHKVSLMDNYRTKGSRHLITYVGNHKVKIGCVIITFDSFFATYKKIGNDYGYSPSQIKEYYKHVERIQNALNKL